MSDPEITRIPTGPPQLPPPANPPPQPAIENESDWLASKLKEANDDSLLYHLAFIWRAKKDHGDGYQQAIDDALAAVRKP